MPSAYFLGKSLKEEQLIFFLAGGLLMVKALTTEHHRLIKRLTHAKVSRNFRDFPNVRKNMPSIDTLTKNYLNEQTRFHGKKPLDQGQRHFPAIEYTFHVARTLVLIGLYCAIFL